MEQLLMGKIIKITGISRETLKFYEKIGLIPPPQRNQSGYRIYPESIFKRLDFIARAKEAGFTLSEISATLLLADKNLIIEPKEFKDCIDKKITDVKSRVRELEIMINELEKIREALDSENICPLIQNIVG